MRTRAKGWSNEERRESKEKEERGRGRSRGKKEGVREEEEEKERGIETDRHRPCLNRTTM